MPGNLYGLMFFLIFLLVGIFIHSVLEYAFVYVLFPIAVITLLFKGVKSGTNYINNPPKKPKKDKKAKEDK